MAEGKQTAKLDEDKVPDPPVQSRRTPSARVAGVSTQDDRDLDQAAEVATVEVTGFEHDGKAVTLRFDGVPAGGGKVPQDTLDQLLANTAVAWQRDEDRRDWVRDYGTRS